MGIEERAPNDQIFIDIPANGGMSKNTTKESKMSDYAAIRMGYTGISRGR
jgi:hypothetical protein